MRQYLEAASMSFAAGAFGGLLSNLAMWGARAYHLAGHLDVSFALALTPGWLYPRIVWGGLWGLLFMLPVVPGRWWLRGLALSLAPSAFQLLYVLPHETSAGFLGLRQGMEMPIFILAVNAVWGIAAAWLLRMTGRA